MAKTGLLILTQPLTHLRALIRPLVQEASSVVSDTLYVCLQPALQNQTVTQNMILQPLLCTHEVQAFVSDIYLSGFNVCQTLDIRVLLSHICTNPNSHSIVPYSLKKEVCVLLSDSSLIKDTWNSSSQTLTDILRNSFKNVKSDLKFNLINAVPESLSSNNVVVSGEILQTYDNVVLGGTFDYIHTGHKLLLTESCLRCEKKLTVGITEGDRNQKKTLWELMEPYARRNQHVVDFVLDVKSNILLETVMIFDPFGPTITDPDLQCIVVSKETEAGGEMVNEERHKRGFSKLDLFIVDLVDDACHSETEESKVSSSSIRKRMLGTLIRPVPNRASLASSPYRIAVTGGIASGKSNVCKELEKLGAKTVNCDLLGHKAYVKGTPAYQAIIKEFSTLVLNEDGEISRPSLGQLVFNDKSKLEKLNSIVWPSIRQLAEEQIEDYKKAGVKVVVLEAAVLLEAGWDDMVHEVWTTFVPKDEALKRIMSRNGLSNDEALKRVNSQISNEDRISKSNVVICPQWEYEVTRKQLLKAWDLLQKRIQKLPNKL